MAYKTTPVDRYCKLVSSIEVAADKAVVTISRKVLDDCPNFTCFVLVNGEYSFRGEDEPFGGFVEEDQGVPGYFVSFANQYFDRPEIQDMSMTVYPKRVEKHE